MDVPIDKDSRIARILAKLLQEKDLIERMEMGEIDIHFKKEQETIQIKVMIK